jgi:hypothetical protein
MAIPRSVAAIGALGLLAQCGVASATMTTPETEAFNLTPAQVTFQVSNDSSQQPPVITNMNDGPALASSLLNFNKFNPGLGDLTAVTISFESTYSLGPGVRVTFVAENTDNLSTQFFADGSLALALTGSGFSDQTLDPTGSASCTSVPCSSTPPATTGNFDGTISPSLASFIGAGTFNLTVALSSALAPRIDPDNGTSFADNVTMDGTLDSNWAGNVSVVYTYNAAAAEVPEPLTLYLVVAGLVVIALLPRRRA